MVVVFALMPDRCDDDRVGGLDFPHLIRPAFLEAGLNRAIAVVARRRVAGNRVPRPRREYSTIVRL